MVWKNRYKGKRKKGALISDPADAERRWGQIKPPNSHEILASYIVVIIFLNGTPRALISLGAKNDQ